MPVGRLGCGGSMEALWKPDGSPAEALRKPCGSPVETRWKPGRSSRGRGRGWLGKDVKGGRRGGGAGIDGPVHAHRLVDVVLGQGQVGERFGRSEAASLEVPFWDFGPFRI
jgi:hypothetical protein